MRLLKESKAKVLLDGQEIELIIQALSESQRIALQQNNLFRVKHLQIIGQKLSDNKKAFHHKWLNHIKNRKIPTDLLSNQ